ncbi:aminotransferase class I/II-fold pyridoxal phosphate-dependent enzyme [Nakamurella flavida]|uniref:histidinol-phosphate transaminase n=1 Tax=Nakamurella flavida TaxID=363630 RepID=A0A938YCJ9_9ACTN|nr:aminotransferase class I/II-fold pyridoxal phosphate-dependent enzyme [Nakamurella flavida]MBM9475160.1 aminotransferase class I/II-fold pyridoxal phosphate-dependent enzyme [Nakamurella flavida]
MTLPRPGTCSSPATPPSWCCWSSSRRRAGSDESWVSRPPRWRSCRRVLVGGRGQVDSQAYALSGLRVAYLCGPAAPMDELRRSTPPWAVSLPGQLAAVRALSAECHYRGRWEYTAVLRDALHRRLSALGLEVVPGMANFLLTYIRDDGPTAAEVVDQCRE